MHVIGIDAGGTKTVCQLADEQGQIVSPRARRRRQPPGRRRAAGREGPPRGHGGRDRRAGRSCRRRSASASPASIVRTTLPRCRGIMKRIGYKARVLVVNDALVALEAGAPGQPGVVIISGTGSIAYGRNAAGEAARAGGWGYVLGDEGSGYWIGRAALRAVLRAADERGPDDGADAAAARALRRRPAAGPASRGLSQQLEAGGDRRARAVRSGGVPAGRRGGDRHPARRGQRARGAARCRWRGGSG